MDESGSVGSGNFENVKDFVSSVISSFAIGPDNVQVGVLTFSTHETFEFFLNTYTTDSDVLKAVDNIVYSGGYTYTADALDAVRTDGFTAANGGRSLSYGIPRVIIVVTDGQSSSTNDTITAARAVQDDGITLFAIGIANANQQELDAIASLSSYKSFLPDFDPDKLRNLQTRISEQACEGEF